MCQLSFVSQCSQGFQCPAEFLALHLNLLHRLGGPQNPHTPGAHQFLIPKALSQLLPSQRPSSFLDHTKETKLIPSCWVTPLHQINPSPTRLSLKITCTPTFPTFLPTKNASITQKNGRFWWGKCQKKSNLCLLFEFLFQRNSKSFLLTPSYCENTREFCQVLPYFWEFCIPLPRFCYYFRGRSSEIWTLPKAGWETAAPMEINEKELGVPTPQSGWSRIQVGIGKKQSKRGGEWERRNSAWSRETAEGGLSV